MVKCILVASFTLDNLSLAIIQLLFYGSLDLASPHQNCVCDCVFVECCMMCVCVFVVWCLWYMYEGCGYVSGLGVRVCLWYVWCVYVMCVVVIGVCCVCGMCVFVVCVVCVFCGMWYVCVFMVRGMCVSGMCGVCMCVCVMCGVCVFVMCVVCVFLVRVVCVCVCSWYV